MTRNNLPRPDLMVEVADPSLFVHHYKSIGNAAEHMTSLEGPVALIALNCEKIVNLKRNKTHFKRPEGCIYYADGVSMLWPVMRSRVVRIPGVELWLEILRQTAPGTSVLVLGGTQDVSREALKKLKADYPDHKTHALDGYQATEQYEEAVRKLSPDLIFIGMGTPKQEQLICRLQSFHNTGLYMGLGGSLDVYVGRVRRANRLMRALGLEWLSRASLNVQRLRRYWVHPVFMKHVLFREFGFRVIRKPAER